MYAMKFWNHEVRTVLGIMVIVAYCLFALNAMSHLRNTKTITQTRVSSPAVIAPPATPIRFNASPDTPDPNIVLKLVNEQRTTAGQPALTADPELETIAKSRASDMVRRNYYAHKNPDGIYFYNLLESNGLHAGFSCENLDLMPSSSEQRAVSDWMNSTAGHKECLLNSSVIKSGYAVQKFDEVHENGQQITLYVVVAIHASE